MFKKYSVELKDKYLSGSAVAEEIMNYENISDVKIEPSRDDFRNSYSYSKKSKRIYLSNYAYDKSAVAAVSAAAHECAHIIQNEKNYFPMKLIRVLGIVFAVMVTLWWGYDGYLLFTMRYDDEYSVLSKIIILMLGGLTLLTHMALSVCVVLSEFDANKRAIKILKEMNEFNESELKMIEKSLKYMCVSSIIDEAR